MNQDGKSLGKGFVTYKNAADATKAIAASGTDFLGRTIEVRLASEPKKYGAPQTQQQAVEGTSAFVGNLSFKSTKESIAKFFESCGKVLEVRIPLNEEGQPRGFAHVNFDSVDALKKAIALSGKELDGRTLRVDVSQPKGSSGSYSRGGYGGRASRGGYSGYRGSNEGGVYRRKKDE